MDRGRDKAGCEIDSNRHLRAASWIRRRTAGQGGCEIDSNRHCYACAPPRPLAEIDADLKRAEEEIVRLLREVAG